MRINWYYSHTNHFQINLVQPVSPWFSTSSHPYLEYPHRTGQNSPYSLFDTTAPSLPQTSLVFPCQSALSAWPTTRNGDACAMLCFLTNADCPSYMAVYHRQPLLLLTLGRVRPTCHVCTLFCFPRTPEGVPSDDASQQLFRATVTIKSFLLLTFLHTYISKAQ